MMFGSGRTAALPQRGDPPADGGFKYQGANGGPADVDTTVVIEGIANALLRDELAEVHSTPFERTRALGIVSHDDHTTPYITDDLPPANAPTFMQSLPNPETADACARAVSPMGRGPWPLRGPHKPRRTEYWDDQSDRGPQPQPSQSLPQQNPEPPACPPAQAPASTKNDWASDHTSAPQT